MALVKMNELDSSAKVWIFPAAAALNEEQAKQIQLRMERFIAGWKAHGNPVAASVEVVDNRFVVIAADSTDVSGCSIDGLFGEIRALQQTLSASLLDSTRIYFRDSAGLIQSATRPEFRNLAAANAVGPDTTIFDSAVDNLADFRAGVWAKPARESWHAAYFEQGSPA